MIQGEATLKEGYKYKTADFFTDSGRKKKKISCFYLNKRSPIRFYIASFLKNL